MAKRKLVATLGLPASGKSTWAEAERKTAGAIVVTKDDIRQEWMNKGWVWTPKAEYDVNKERDKRILEAFEKGATYVISADTNLNPDMLNQLATLAYRVRARFDVRDFRHVSLDECIRRDANRNQKEVWGHASIGEKAIRDMAERWLKPEQLVKRLGEPQLFVDLDGVLADFDGFVAKTFGEEFAKANSRDAKEERDDFWPTLRSYEGRLYYDMQPFDWSEKLWYRLKQFKPIILTGCPWSIPTAADDKRAWVKKYVDPDVQVVCCKSRNKSNYMKKGDILLDDWPKYKSLWEDRGGKFILFQGDVDMALLEIEEALNG